MPQQIEKPNETDRSPAAREGPVRWFRWLKLGSMPRAVANNGLHALEASLGRLDLAYRVSPRNSFTQRMNLALAKFRLVRKIARLGKTVYFVPLGHIAEYRYCPYTYFHEIVPWCFDSWPNLRDRIEGVLRRNRVKVALFTSRQSADYFRERLGIDAIWLPEACDPNLCRPAKLLQDRTIDVLELGRKFDRYHDAIAPRLAQLGKRHLFEKVKGQLIFPTAEGLTEGFAEARISVSFPSSMTHPERSGNCETVTLRYFESMASRCLIVGHCPAELIDIMGYNPVIEADMENAAGQVEHILSNINTYQEFVDRNYQTVLRRGIWDVRVQELLAELEKRGYSPEPARH